VASVGIGVSASTCSTNSSGAGSGAGSGGIWQALILGLKQHTRHLQQTIIGMIEQQKQTSNSQLKGAGIDEPELERLRRLPLLVEEEEPQEPPVLLLVVVVGFFVEELVLLVFAFVEVLVVLVFAFVEVLVLLVFELVEERVLLLLELVLLVCKILSLPKISSPGLWHSELVLAPVCSN